MSEAAAGRLRTRPGPGRDADPLAPGVHELHLGAGATAVLAVPPGQPRPHPLLVFCHGAGGTAEQSLAAAGRSVAQRGAALLAPSSSAATWDLLTGGLGRDVAALDAALAAADAVLAVDRVGIAGFSDGASYALSLGLANGDLFDAVLALSPGFVAPPGRTGQPRVWICHGTADRVLPVDRCGRRVARGLDREGYDVTYREFDGGHVMSDELVLEALDWWLGPPPS